MAERKRTLRICPMGHQYYKSTDCGTCPKSDRTNKPSEEFLSRLSSPARNAIINAGITEMEHLAEYTEKEILQLHGIGPSSLPTLKHAMAEKNVNFKS